MEPHVGYAGRVAVISGGTGEIGRDVAARLLHLGARVHCLDLKAPPVSSGGPSVMNAAFHAVDVTNETHVDAAIDGIARDEGRIDYLIYCAGVFRPCSVMEMSSDELTRTIAINLSGAFLCCRAAARAMCTRRFGRIVLISSLIARVGTINGAHYAASKGGLLGLVRGLALELEENGIRINTVSPGVVDTAMPRAHSSEEKLAQVGRSIPLQRIARVDDVAEACLFFVDEDSACLTGQDLPVNGGGALTKPSGTVAVIAGTCDATALAIARRLTIRGDGIALLGNEALKLQPLLASDKAAIEALHADVSDRRAVEQAIAHAQQKLGSIKRLICGMSVQAQPKPLSAMTYADWSTQVEAPLTQFLSISQGAFPSLANCKGAILFLLSDHAAIGLRHAAAHASVQSSLESFIKCLAREFASADVRVNAISSGTVVVSGKIEKGNELSEDIAALADFLLSKRAPYITGQLVLASGFGHDRETGRQIYK